MHPIIQAEVDEYEKGREEAIKQVGEKLPKSKVLPRRYDCKDCLEIMKDLERDDATCAICNGERGFNAALSAVREILSTDQ